MADDWEEMREELEDDPPQPVVGDYSDDLWVLSKVVPEVLAYAVRARHAETPREVSQQRFNDARIGANHPRCPTAQGLHQRFKLDWREIKDISQDGIARIFAVLRPIGDTPVEVTVAHVNARVRDAWSIRVQELIVDGVGGEDARDHVLTRDEYVRISDERRADSEARYKRGVPVRWPTISQVDNHGGLPATLKRLGLPHARSSSTSPGRAVGGPGKGWTRRERVVALMRYLASPGASTRDLKRGYRVWHGKQKDRDELPSHGTFLGNDTFGSLLPKVYEVAPTRRCSTARSPCRAKSLG